MADVSSEEYYEPEEIEEYWSEEVLSLEGMAREDVNAHLHSFDTYPKAKIFWVEDNGQLLMSQGLPEELNKDWDISAFISYIKEDNEQELFTTSSYLEGAEDSGHVFLQLPLSSIESQVGMGQYQYSTIWFIAIGSFWVLFVYISWLFFNKTRKRLVKIEENMKTTKNQLVPSKMDIEKDDEIGQIEHSFNQMVDQLNESHEKEKNEALIRKRLISSLSHDLRTPLSIINGHAHKLNQYHIDAKMRESVHVINEKIEFLAELIDNLTSFTVLSEGKLPFNYETIDIVEIVRSSLIAWYPIFEEAGFEIEVDLDESAYWDMDRMWFRRILDNLLQNVHRHAQEGKYLSVRTEKEGEEVVLKIEDGGPGMYASSKNSGSGVGLSIVNMMLEQMKLKKTVSSSQKGTVVTIKKKEHETIYN